MYDTLEDLGIGQFYGEHDPALVGVGDYRHLLRVHEHHADLVVCGHCPDLPPIGPLLMRRLADARTMMSACQDLLRRGPKAAGVNGLCLELLDRTELWSLCRETARAIREGTYEPSGDRKVPVPKEGKPGEFRELTIQNAEDRVVGRALVRILQPLVDPVFSPFSFGFRPRRGPQAALATALALAQAQQWWVWVADDVAKAFDKIPFNRFLNVCQTHFPADVVEFISLLAYTGKLRGLRQGSPISPLLFNIFFDYLLDWPWNAAWTEVPLLRYADDLLLLCRTTDEAIAAYDDLARRTTAIGSPLKGTRDSSVHDLAAGDRVDWLGYQVGFESNHPTVRIVQRAWDRLVLRLAKAHLLPASPIRAIQIIRGWLAYVGPCLPHEDRGAVVRRVRQIAVEAAFDEIPPEQELLQVWSAAHARWARLYARQAALLTDRLCRLNERRTIVP